MKLSEIATLFNFHMNDQLVSRIEIGGVSIDSRQVLPGQLFIAIKGERFDGHDFIEQAIANGAVAAIVSKPLKTHIPLFTVPDPTLALAQIAQYHRNQFNIPVIALTGSCGKTTVKEMIAAILTEYCHAFASQGNFNNHIGVPLSLLKLNAQHQAAVFELGANRVGDIAYTVKLVKPSIALITNVAPAHLQGFGSIDGVMQAKSEIYQGLNSNGIAIINADDDFAPQWREQLKGMNVLSFGLKHAADITATHIYYNSLAHPRFHLITPVGKSDISLQVAGLHNVMNALAATAATVALSIPLTHIQKGLEKFNAVPGRMVFKSGMRGAIILDDSYNANLKSVLAALDVLAQLPGQRILVLGDMAELGDAASEHHRIIGEKAIQLGIDNLFTCGKLSRFSSEAFAGKGRHYVDQASLLEELIPLLNEKTHIVVKGSRSSHMEHIIAALTC